MGREVLRKCRQGSLDNVRNHLQRLWTRPGETTRRERLCLVRHLLRSVHRRRRVRGDQDHHGPVPEGHARCGGQRRRHDGADQDEGKGAVCGEARGGLPRGGRLRRRHGQLGGVPGAAEESEGEGDPDVPRVRDPRGGIDVHASGRRRWPGFVRRVPWRCDPPQGAGALTGRARAPARQQEDSRHDPQLGSWPPSNEECYRIRQPHDELHQLGGEHVGPQQRGPRHLADQRQQLTRRRSDDVERMSSGAHQAQRT
mmetsp:Transcript_7317/g.19652  ORF Transcript_7317/g.19652 Transcript_7317/m.19652 type:complete len:255 (-) Transcript_7317:369-1133(-)